MTINIEPLPYASNAFGQYISEQTLNLHHGKHYTGYVNKLNDLVKETELNDKNLVEIINISHKNGEMKAIFNNSAQIWNHEFYFNCLDPNGGGVPKGVIFEKIEQSFGDFTTFLEKFKTAALNQFGSGWTWLCFDKKTQALVITGTQNAETPITNSDIIPLLTIDVWEHAYYVDYQNRRADYIDVFLSKLINWSFVSENLENAIAS